MRNEVVLIKIDRVKNFLNFFHQLELSWQIYSLLLIYIIIMLTAFVLKIEIGILLLLLLIAIFIFIYYYTNRFVSRIKMIANQLAKDIIVVNEKVYDNSVIGILLYDQDHRLSWGNSLANSIINYKNAVGQKLEDINPDLMTIIEIIDKEWQVITYNEKHYRVSHDVNSRAIYWIEFENEYNIQQQYKNNRIVYGYLLLDDFDEVVQSLDDQEASNFDADLINELNNWAQQQDIYIKRIEDDKFILLLNVKTLEKLENQKFKYFSEIREKYYARNIPISMSIGIAYSKDDKVKINRLAKEAQMNLDLALGRGGDQVVVKMDEEPARFYGGDTNPTEKRTNTRSKLVYQALINQIDQASNVIISGHKYPDMDSLSSALGIYKIATERRKLAKIIINESTFNTDIKNLLNSPQISYNLKNIFIDSETAKTYLNPKTLLILVDHHRPSLSEAEQLFVYGLNIVVIDHHRRSEEFPKQTVLTYIETTASSTSELITEFFMNVRNDSEPVNRFEATALLAGIIVDTNNFSMRTGSRTFDAASYLKSRGADTEQIQRMLQEDLLEVKKRNQLIERTEFYDSVYAITQSESGLPIDNVTAAQAADGMLSLTHVEAAFVIFERTMTSIGISARSLGKINVQKIMESLGGGGHLSNAAAQLENITVDEAKDLLLQAINQNK